MRVRKPPPKTYWEEYVETDEWYKAKMLEDIPAEEMVAALIDEDWGEEILSEEEEDADADESDDHSESPSEASEASDSASVGEASEASEGE